VLRSNTRLLDRQSIPTTTADPRWP